MLNGIVWNRTVHLYKMDLASNKLQRLIYYEPEQKTNKQKLPLKKVIMNI